MWSPAQTRDIQSGTITFNQRHAAPVPRHANSTPDPTTIRNVIHVTHTGRKPTANTRHILQRPKISKQRAVGPSCSCGYVVFSKPPGTQSVFETTAVFYAQIPSTLLALRSRQPPQPASGTAAPTPPPRTKWPAEWRGRQPHSLRKREIFALAVTTDILLVCINLRRQ